MQHRCFGVGENNLLDSVGADEASLSLEFVFEAHTG